MIDVQISQLTDAFGVGIWVYEKNDADGTVKIVRPLEITLDEHIVGSHLPAPTFSTRTQWAEMFLEKLVERLKEAGYGRDKVSVESGELKATKQHLDDMKRLVFTPPAHLLPIVISGAGEINRSDMGYAAAPKHPMGLTVDPGRVLRAAKTCKEATAVLKQLFPELFPPGWESR